MADVCLVSYSWRTSRDWTRNDDVKHLSLTLIPTVWLIMSWRPVVFLLLFLKVLWLLFSKRKLLFVTSHRSLFLFTCRTSGFVFTLPAQIIFSLLYKRTPRSVILLMDQDFNKVVIAYLTFVCFFIIMIKRAFLNCSVKCFTFPGIVTCFCKLENQWNVQTSVYKNSERFYFEKEFAHNYDPDIK